MYTVRHNHNRYVAGGKIVKLSVIIPAYNEQNQIGQTIDELVNTLKGWDLQIVAVDDGSTDRTRQELVRITKRYPKQVTMFTYPNNMGKGFAVYSGFKLCKHRARLILDADLSVKPLELLTMTLPKNAILKGQRVQVVSQPLFRIAVGKVWKVLVWVVTGLYMDSQCPYTYLDLPKKFYEYLEIDGFAFDVELLYKARKQGYPILKTDVDYYNRRDSTVTLTKTYQMFKDIIRIPILYSKSC